MTTAINGLDVYRRELLKGSTETLILSLLADQEMYGYQLAKEMERRSGGYFHLKEGDTVPRPSQAGAGRPDRGALGAIRNGSESPILPRQPPGHGPSRSHVSRMEHLLGRGEPDRQTGERSCLRGLRLSHSPNPPARNGQNSSPATSSSIPQQE